MTILNLCINASVITTSLFYMGLYVDDGMQRLINPKYPINDSKTVNLFGYEFKRNYFTSQLKRSSNGLDQFVRTFVF